MQKNYESVALDKAYRLVNYGPMVWVSTVSEEGDKNIAPISWNCPIQKEPTQVLVGIGSSHRTYRNIMATDQFVLCLPMGDLREDVLATGKVSGEETNKFEKFDLNSFPAEEVEPAVVDGCVGYLECELLEELERGSVSLLIAKVVSAAAHKEGFTDKNRMNLDNPQGRPLHHLGGSKFGVLFPPE